MKKILYSVLILAATLTTVSCEKNFLDINTDPNAITKYDIAQALTFSERYTAASLSSGSTIDAAFASYAHHTCSRELDNYASSSNYYTMVGNTWLYCYVYANKQNDALITNGDAEGKSVYAGIGRVLKAFMFMSMVDLWGDVPYSEYNVNGNTAPKADSGVDIYNACLVLLNEALDNFKNVEGAKPAKDDLIYTGDVAKWIKAANTIKLRLLLQSRKASSEITGWDGELSSLLAENDFIVAGGDFQFPHSATTSPADERHSGYLNEYFAGQKGAYISPMLYECMSGKDYNFKNNPFRSVVDPRIPYYFYNQLTATAAAENPTDYRDGAFVSMVFASNSGFTSSSMASSMTTLGIYPVGGKFDDGKGGKTTSTSGTGIAPDKFVQAYSVPFMKAELVLAGEMTGDAKAYLEEGIRASFAHVNAVSQAAKGAAAVPVITPEAITTFVTGILAKYDAATTTEARMEMVMTQKWVANFYNPIEAYNDMRRTGYPNPFTGDSNGYGWSPYAQQTAAKAELTQIDLITLRAYPRVLLYPQSETEANPNITNEGRVVGNQNVFWDVQCS